MLPSLTPRRTIALTFASFGIGAGLWGGASAALISRAGLTPGQFGLALTVFTVIYLIGMSFASTLARSFGLQQVVIASALACAPTVATIVTSASSAQFLGGLLTFGFAGGVLDSAMNAEGAALERQLRLPILAQFHGCASAGGAVGFILGSAIVGGPHPWIGAGLETALFAFCAAAVGSRGPIDTAPPPDRSPELKPRVLTRPIVVLGLVVGVCIASETSAQAWSALLLAQDAPKLAWLAGLGGAFFSICQATVRFNADRVRSRLDDRTAMAISLALAAAGLVVVALPFGFAGAVLGFAIFGFGTGAVVPCGFALASARPDVSTAASISAVAFFGLFARPPAPLVIGAIADAGSLSLAFLVLAALLVVALVALLAFVPAPNIILRRASS